jgi:hypothetical protein
MDLRMGKLKALLNRAVDDLETGSFLKPCRLKGWTKRQNRFGDGKPVGEEEPHIFPHCPDANRPSSDSSSGSGEGFRLEGHEAG